jgi:hypothetical protein
VRFFRYLISSDQSWWCCGSSSACTNQECPFPCQLLGISHSFQVRTHEVFPFHFIGQDRVRDPTRITGLRNKQIIALGAEERWLLRDKLRSTPSPSSPLPVTSHFVRRAESKYLQSDLRQLHTNEHLPYKTDRYANNSAKVCFGI